MIFRHQEDTPPALTSRSGTQSEAISRMQAGAKVCRGRRCVRLVSENHEELKTVRIWCLVFEVRG